jgi:16S rRNA C1402 (ribose-2'-O) methylase RsmI
VIGDEGPPASTVSFSARGHPDVRATHAKTIEFVADPHITARATCVVGVSAGLPYRELARFRGPVVVDLRAGPHHERVTAVANPHFSSEDRMILRRSAHRSPETFATGADKAAADLGREMIRALGDPAVELVVTVSAANVPAIAASEVVVLRRFPAVNPDGGSAARELDAASVVLDADGSGQGRLPSGREVPVVSGAAGAEAGRRALERGGVVVVAGDPALDEAAAAFVRGAVDAGVAVRAVDEPDHRVAALLATGLTAGRAAFLGRPPNRREERGRVLAAAAQLGAVAVWEGRGDALHALLVEAAGHWGGAVAGLLMAPGQADESHTRGSAAQLAEAAAASLDRRRSGVLVVDLTDAAASPVGDGLDALIAALLAEGVTARTLTAALQRLPGMSRRRAYDLVLAVKADMTRSGQ